MEAPPCFRAPALLVSLVLLLLLRLSPTSSSAAVPVSRTIVVDQRGGGDFERVQLAVNAVPDGNREWVRIHVRNGSYWEKVKIPREKGFILLQGDGSWNTAISFNGHAPAPNGTDDDLILTALANGTISNGDGGDGDNPTIESATFTVLADDFAAQDIAFRNTYNEYHKDNARRALAALIGGDRSAFRRCGFYGFQDTLCDHKGRHYFQSCSINGGVDFIFGYGQSIYDGCSVVSNVPPAWGKQAGFVTAHARVDGGRPGGLVFRGGQVLGTGRQYLGRAWNRFATVVFYKVAMAGIVVPQGWEAWKAGNDTGDVTFAEVGCSGLGAERAGRVPWEKTLSEAQVEKVCEYQLHRRRRLAVQAAIDSTVVSTGARDIVKFRTF